jgi:cytochrome o ubiquinol oxidase subunit 2
MPLILLIAVVLAYLPGCSAFNLIDLQPAGPVAHAIDKLFWLALTGTATVLVVVFALTVWIVTKYRASKHPVEYKPKWDEPPWLEWLIWLFPSVIVLTLGMMTWIYTHKLDPHRPLPVSAEPIEIQVVALDWKWLFIYPEQNIATINQVALPAKRPIAFKITSGTVMNSFFIPRLGGQIYAMAGMQTPLHLLADKAGRYFGENIQYSGRGFSSQHFEVLALTAQDFAQWLDKVRNSKAVLNMKQYRELAKPTVDHKVEYYAAVEPNLFAGIIAQFATDRARKPTVLEIR